jgi:hypothetical protein
VGLPRRGALRRCGSGLDALFTGGNHLIFSNSS